MPPPPPSLPARDLLAMESISPTHDGNNDDYYYYDDDDEEEEEVETTARRRRLERLKRKREELRSKRKKEGRKRNRRRRRRRRKNKDQSSGGDHRDGDLNAEGYDGGVGSQLLQDRWSLDHKDTFTTYGPAYIVYDDGGGYGGGHCVKGINPALALLTLGGAAVAALAVFRQVTQGGRRRRRRRRRRSLGGSLAEPVILGSECLVGESARATRVGWEGGGGEGMISFT